MTIFGAPGDRAARPPGRRAGRDRRHLAGRQRHARGRRRRRPSACAGCWSRCRCSTTRCSAARSPSPRCWSASPSARRSPALLGARRAARAPRTGSLLADMLLDWVSQDPKPSASVLQGLFFGRVAPPTEERRKLEPADARDRPLPRPDPPVLGLRHARARAAERAAGARPRSILELRLTPERLTGEIVEFVERCFKPAADRPSGPPPRRQRAAAETRTAPASLPPRCPAAGSRKEALRRERERREAEARAAAAAQAPGRLRRRRRAGDRRDRDLRSSWSWPPAGMRGNGVQREPATSFPSGGSVPEQKVFDLRRRGRRGWRAEVERGPPRASTSRTPTRR